MKKLDNEFYDSIAAANEGVTAKDVKSLFVWYDLLSYALPFQFIFVLIYLIGAEYYAFTMFSVLGIFIIDTVLKNILEKDASKFVKLQAQMPLVKLWVIPLVFMGICTTTALIISTFQLI